MRTLIRSCIGTKFVSRYGDLICDMALDAVLKVTVDVGGTKEIDIKRYAKVEKVSDHRPRLGMRASLLSTCSCSLCALAAI
jgi:hypothetical protein